MTLSANYKKKPRDWPVQQKSFKFFYLQQSDVKGDLVRVVFRIHVDLGDVQNQLSRFVILGLVENASLDLILARVLVGAVEAMTGRHNPLRVDDRTSAELVALSEDWLLEQGHLPRPAVGNSVFASDDLGRIRFDGRVAAIGWLILQWISKSSHNEG